jgi:hypothetical protein
MSLTPSTPTRPFSLTRVLVGLLLFGVSFGYIEAAVVVYLRTIYDPIRERLNPDIGNGDLFPLIRMAELEAEGDVHVHRLGVEVGREAMTLILLVAAGLLVGRNFHQWFASFMITFGLWDIFYYVFLKMLIDWPASLFTWDILFLIPLPWTGQVIAPILVSIALISAGLAMWYREWTGRPMRIRWYHWITSIIGGFIIIVAFCWDYRNIMDGGLPNPFNWPMFFAGLLLGLAAFVHAYTRLPARKGAV